MMKTILVQLSTPHWTRQAVHLACAMARSQHSEVKLLRLVPVGNPGYLGTWLGYKDPPRRQQEEICEYAATAEDYAVPITLCEMQCLAPLEAIAAAADQVDAEAVFVHVPPSRLPGWQKLRIWWLRAKLAAHFRQLYTLTETLPVAPELSEAVPAIHYHPVIH